MKIPPWTLHINFIWISWSHLYWWVSWSIHIKFMKISRIILLWNLHENASMNSSDQFHMNIMITFLPMGLMKHSYQIHGDFLNNFFYEISMKIPIWTVHVLSYKYHDQVSTDRSMKGSYKIHENFMYTFLMKYSW